MNSTKAKLHYITESGKSACVSTKPNEFASNHVVGFVALGPTLKDKEEGFEFDLPGGWTLEPMYVWDNEAKAFTDEPVLTKDGEHKKRFVW